MRLPLKRGFECGYAVTSGAPDRLHYVVLWTQPWHLWLAGRVYHWYDMRIYKVPGFRTLEDWLLRREERRRPDDELSIPLSCKQDLRCYDLTVRRRTVLATIDIGPDVYERIRSGEPS